MLDYLKSILRYSICRLSNKDMVKRKNNPFHPHTYKEFVAANSN